jgi:autotransporter-associated beta strand protein
VNAIAGSLIVGDGISVASVIFGAANQVGNSQSITVNANATVNLQGFSDEVGALNFNGGTLAIGAGTLTINGDITATGTSSITGGTLSIKEVTRTINVAGGAQLTISAAITSIFGAGITKTGTGTLISSGTNTFTGTMAVNAGVLLLSTGSLTGPVNVAAGATLSGSGATGPVTFASNSATFSANIASNGGNQVNAKGDVNLNGATLDIVLGTTPAPNQSFTILTSTTKITGTFAGFANNQLVMVGGHLYRINYNLTSVVLTFVS